MFSGDNSSQESFPLRVGIVTTSFPVSTNPTSGIFVKRLVSHLPATISTTVLIPCPDTALERCSSMRYRLTCFAYGPCSWRRLAHYPGGIPDALHRRDPALLLLPLLIPTMFYACLRLAGRVDVLHGNWSLSGLIAALAGKLRGKPAVTTLRGEDIVRAGRSRLFRWTLRSCLALNHHTVVVSEAMRESLCCHFPKWADRIEFIPNGVSQSESPPDILLHSPLRLLVVGSLIRRKRIETLIQAVAQLKETTDSVLRILGDGPERCELKSLAEKLNIEHIVEFRGGIPPEEVEQHLRWADIFVFASESEGRPNAILEAMASGLPLVATDIPGIQELVGTDAGLLYPVGESAELARCIETLASNPDYARQLGRKARERINKDCLTWKATGERYAALYLRAVNGDEDR